MSKQPTWVLVANSSHVKIFKLINFPKLQAIKTFSHPESRLHDSELVSDRPGRCFDSMGGGRHSYEDKTDPKFVEIEKFAKILADFLSSSHENGDFTRLYLLANPSFLGLLRQHLNPKIHAAIVSEIAKDMTEHTTEDIEAHLLAI